MKKFFYCLVFVFVVAGGGIAHNASAFSGFGNGTAESPYLVANCVDLQSIASTESSSGKIYWLEDSIDCSETSTWNENGAGGFYGFRPIEAFGGTLDGRGHTILNLYINRPDSASVGMFSYIFGAFISSINLTGVNIKGGAGTGALVGAANSGSYLHNIGVNGVVTGSADVGGLIGVSFNSINIYDSYVNVVISSTGGNTGGLIGRANNNDVSIERSYSTGSITSTGKKSGGTIGYIHKDSGRSQTFNIKASFSNSIISNTGDKGGIVGSIDVSDGDSSIVDSYYDLAGSVFSCVGSGSLGFTLPSCYSFDSGAGDSSYLKNSIINPPLDQWDFTNKWATSTGLSVLRNDYFFAPAGQVTSLHTEVENRNTILLSWDTPSNIGGLDLRDNDTYEYEIKKHGNSYAWDDSKSAFANNSATPISFNNLILGESYDLRVRAYTEYGPGEWNTITQALDSPTVHYISSCIELQNIASIGGNMDTYKLSDGFSCSETTNWNPADAYCTNISIANEVECLARNSDWHPAYNEGFNPISWSDDENGLPFQGTLDGQGHIITGLNINRPQQSGVGIFNELGDSATITNLTIEGGSVLGGNDVGAIAGSAYGEVAVTDVTSSANVTGLSYYKGYYNRSRNTGGLIGYYSSSNDSASILTLSGNTISGIIKGADNTGGLLGSFEVYTSQNSDTTITDNTIKGGVLVEKQTKGAYAGDFMVSGGIGGLVGYYYLKDDKENINNNLTVSGNTITSDVSLEGLRDVGGLFGYLEFYNDDYNDAIVTANLGPNNAVLADFNVGDANTSPEHIGGLIGEVNLNMTNDRDSAKLNIFKSFVGGDINITTNNDSYDIGGLIGYAGVNVWAGNGSQVSIKDSYYSGNIRGGKDYLYSSGGLIGETYDDNFNLGETTIDIERSYSSGSLAGNEFVGGLIGYNYAITNIVDSFSANSIDAGLNYGAIIGSDDSGSEYLTFLNTYYDEGKNSGISCYGGSGSIGACVGVNTTEIPSPNYFFNNTGNEPFDSGDWDFNTVWKTNTTNYPTLKFYEREEAASTCSDGILNQNETSIDKGGVCTPTPRISGSRVTGSFASGINKIIQPVVTTPVVDTPSLGKKGLCSETQILTENLKSGARNGFYNKFAKKKVTEVKILQAHMNRLGFASGKEDGILGPITDGAIKRMQKFLGTIQDGLVGSLTRELINNSCGEKS